MVLQDGADLPEKHLRELDVGGGTWEVRLPPAAFAFDKNHPVDVHEEKQDYAIVYQRQAMARLEELFPSCPARDFVEARCWILDHLERMEFVDGAWTLTDPEGEEERSQEAAEAAEEEGRARADFTRAPPDRAHPGPPP